MCKIRLGILIILTGCISLIYGLPNIVIPVFLKDKQYTPLPIADHVIDETYIYAPKTREVLMGNLFSYDALSFKTRKFPSPFVGETLPANLMALLAKITGSLANGFIMADFLFPAITFFIMYRLIKELTNNYYLSILGALVAIISYDFIAYVPYPIKMLKYFFSDNTNSKFLYYSRAFHPQISVLILILSEYLTIIALKTKKIKDIIIAGLCSGLLFYTYFFCWTFFYFGLILFLFWLLLRKKKQDAKTILIIVFVGILIGSYYLINLLIFKYSFASSDFFEKLSLAQLSFYPTTFRYLILVLFLLIFRKKLKDKIYFIIFLIISGSLLPHLSEIILGRDIEGYHWVRRALMPTANILFIVFILNVLSLISNAKIVNKFKIFIKYPKIIFILLIILYGFTKQYFTARNLYKIHTIEPNQVELFNYINSSLTDKSLIGSISLSEQFILPVYTSSLPFIPKASITLMTTDEILDRWLLINRVFNMSEENLKNFLTDSWDNSFKRVSNYDRGVPGYIFYFKTDGENRNELSEVNIKRILKKYQETRPENITKTEVNYLLEGPLEREFEQINLKEYNFLKIVFQNEKYTLYQVI